MVGVYAGKGKYIRSFRQYGDLVGRSVDVYVLSMYFFIVDLVHV